MTGGAWPWRDTGAQALNSVPSPRARACGAAAATRTHFSRRPPPRPSRLTHAPILHALTPHRRPSSPCLRRAWTSWSACRCVAAVWFRRTEKFFRARGHRWPPRFFDAERKTTTPAALTHAHPHTLTPSGPRLLHFLRRPGSGRPGRAVPPRRPPAGVGGRPVPGPAGGAVRFVYVFFFSFSLLPVFFSLSL